MFLHERTAGFGRAVLVVKRRLCWRMQSRYQRPGLAAANRREREDLKFGTRATCGRQGEEALSLKAVVHLEADTATG